MKAKLTTVLLLSAAMTWSCTHAQTSNTADEECTQTQDSCAELEDCTCGEGDEIIIVNFTGQQPTIIDFTRAFLSIGDMGEGFGSFREAFERYEKGQKPEHGELLVDKPNGYISYDLDWSQEDPETQLIATNEMCYWNCKDGRHKVIASNIRLQEGKQYIQTEVTGLILFLYDSETHMLEWMTANEVGAYVEPAELCWPAQDPDDPDSDIDYQPYQAVYFLPRVGKNIKVEPLNPTMPVTKFRRCELIWNGKEFTKKFSK